MEGMHLKENGGNGSWLLGAMLIKDSLQSILEVVDDETIDCEEIRRKAKEDATKAMATIIALLPQFGYSAPFPDE
jgi:hypothetical protein